MNDTKEAATASGPGSIGTQGTEAQRTLRHAISCVGVGRHSGARVSVTLQPALAGTGIRFRRSDRPGAGCLKARPEQLVIAEHALILADAEGNRIVGIEHVMAALAMTGIDNALIEVSGPELPAMDGSAQPFVFLIECAGAVEQDAARLPCPPPPLVNLRRDDAMARIAPSAAPHLATEITDAGSNAQRHVVALQRGPLRHELAAARLPLTTAAIEAAQARGLMRGVSLENTLIFNGCQPVNTGGLRFPDEAARHANVLALASLSLLRGLPTVELFTRGASHALLARLLRQCHSIAAEVETTALAIEVKQAPPPGTGQGAFSPAETGGLSNAGFQL